MLPPIAKEPCLFYKTNSCTKGDACPYSHTGVPQGPSRIVCKHYNTGTCGFGERCRNIHATPNKNAPGCTKVPCRFWAAGNCAKGGQCTFSHGPLASDATSWREQRPNPSASLNFGKSVTPATTLPKKESGEQVRLAHL